MGRHLVLLAVAAAVAASPGVAQDTIVVRSTSITYLTSVTAYVAAGRDDGLAPGATLEVRRAGSAIGLLTVTDVSSHRAACAITRADQPLAVGDSATYRPVAMPPTQLAAADVAPPRSSGRKGPPPIRGRVGVRYLYSRGSNDSRTLSQPALDLRLDGANIARTGIGLSVDVRARWSNSGGAGVVSTTDGLARVYQASLFWEPVGGPVRAVVGRQMSPTLATVAFLDGVLLEAHGRSWAVGAVGGTEPDPATFDPSGLVKDFGGYVTFRSPVGASAKRWTATLGAMGSYTEGHSNREFAYLQGGYMDTRFSAFFAQEVDYYAPWKVAAGEASSVSFTSTFANVRWRIASPVTIAAGYDNRRNVRLFRDAVNPETQFDDAFRQGFWGSVYLNPGRHLQFGVEARSGRGGSVGEAAAYTLTSGVYGLGRLGMAVRARATRYDNPSADGWLGSMAVSMAPGSRVSLELNGGIRTESNPLNDPVDQSLYWVGGYADVALLRTLYLMISATHETGSLDGVDQGYVGVSYRF
ncbi:MAG TPA: hypothetical protein VFY20_12115 [Gemmatimonadales bacterium]|nr:hypothetical protein [Gemmatimonadales bacterium]